MNNFNLAEALYQEKQKENGLKVVSIAELLNMEFPPRENIIEPWLPTQGLAMVYGSRGIGKTFIALNLAVAVSSGGSFLRWTAPKPRGVLYIDGEMSAISLQERLSQIIDSSNIEPSSPLTIITPDMQSSGMPNLATDVGQERIEPHLQGISLVIVDNISCLCNGGRENEGESWLPVQEWALRLRSNGLSVVFMHHAGKTGLQRGTSRREDVLDTVIGLKHPGDYSQDQGARFEVCFEKSRGVHGDCVKPFDARLVTEPDGKLVWTMKDLEESFTEKVADLFKDGVPQHEIAEILGKSKGTISKHVKQARRNGLIE